MAQGLSIVGYFHANERFDDVELCGVAKNIGDHISRYFPQAPILLVSKCLILCLWNALARQEAKGCEYPVFRASLRLMLRSPKSKCSSISPVFFLLCIIILPCSSSIISHLRLYINYYFRLKERQWCDYLWFASMSDSNLLSI